MVIFHPTGSCTACMLCLSYIVSALLHVHLIVIKVELTQSNVALDRKLATSPVAFW